MNNASKSPSLGQLKVLVRGDGCWGVGKTYGIALANCMRENKAAKDKHQVYIVHPKTKIDPQGGFVVSVAAEELEKWQPRLIHEIE